MNVDFPVDLLSAIDREAKRVGVSRQAFIKLRLADTLRFSVARSYVNRGCGDPLKDSSHLREAIAV